MADAVDDHPMFSVYEVLAHLGINPALLTANFDASAFDADNLFVALEETKVGIASALSRIGSLPNEGWYLATFTDAELAAFASVYRALQALAQEHIRRDSSINQTKTGSKEEERLMAAILRAGLPTPERNYTAYKENGKELTVPDFAWPDMKIAFYMDGLWWHRGLDDKKVMDALKDAADDKAKRKALSAGEQSRAQRDGNNRSELAAQGWIILTCTDADLSSASGVDAQVERIQKTMRSLRERTSVAAQNADADDFDPFDTL